jgi:formate/nitrite transporter FocA (FNT family)
LAGLAVAGLIGGLILAGAAVLVWPIALAMLAGVVVAFGVANLYLIVLATRRVRQALTLEDLRGGLLGSLGLTLVELAGLSMLRGFLIATYGFSWGV